MGDPEQLASVEAGAVLGDVVGPATIGTTDEPSCSSTQAAVQRSSSRRRRPRSSKAVEAHSDRRRDRGASTSAPLRGGDRAALGHSVKTGDAYPRARYLRGDRADVTWIVADAEDGHGLGLEGVPGSHRRPCRTHPRSARSATPPWMPAAGCSAAQGSATLGEAISALNSFRSSALTEEVRPVHSPGHPTSNGGWQRASKASSTKATGTSVVPSSSRPTTTASASTTATPAWS